MQESSVELQNSAWNTPRQVFLPPAFMVGIWLVWGILPRGSLRSLFPFLPVWDAESFAWLATSVFLVAFTCWYLMQAHRVSPVLKLRWRVVCLCLVALSAWLVNELPQHARWIALSQWH